MHSVLAERGSAHSPWANSECAWDCEQPLSREHPALRDLRLVAQALGPLRDRVVFIGGAIAPLLQTSPPFPRARATSDVDAVIATTSYAEFHRVSKQLRTLGFRQEPGDSRHVHRWRSPEGLPFDLVPAGKHLGTSGNWLDDVAAQTAETTTLESGLMIRRATAPSFLALKWAAHNDRGATDPLASHDLEDLVALLASRPGVERETAKAPPRLRAYLAKQARGFLTDPSHEDLLAAHLNNAQDAAHVVRMVRRAIEAIAAAR